MILYKTILGEAKAENVIEKSRFICHMKPVSSKEEAMDFINSIKKEHYNATHNVPAMVIGDKMQLKWCSDDGEPQGTSGQPILSLITNEGLTNICVVVTRYFGGIKLGTGGLARAYSGTAKLCLDMAEICQVENQVVLDYEIDYSYLQKIQNLAQKSEYPVFSIADVTYTENVRVKIAVSIEEEELVKDLITGLTSGKAEIKNREITEIKNKLK